MTKGYTISMYDHWLRNFLIAPKPKPNLLGSLLGRSKLMVDEELCQNLGRHPFLTKSGTHLKLPVGMLAHTLKGCHM